MAKNYSKTFYSIISKGVFNMNQLKEKKKALVQDIHIICPSCKKYIFGHILFSDYTEDTFPNRCPLCGQKMD